ncbi:MAG: 50S ribosomal protein L1 [Thermoproteota archaeon]
MSPKLPSLEEVTRQLIEKALNETNNKKRNFLQSVELYVKLREIDLKKPENRFSLQVELPNFPSSKENKVAVITSGALLAQARKLNVPVISREDLESLAGNKKAARKLASQYDFFISEVSLMPLVGKILGPFLGPKDRMPIAVAPNADITSTVERLKRSVLVRIKSQSTVSSFIGTEDMPVEKLNENAAKIISALEQKIQDARRKIDKIVVKTTMGSPVHYKRRKGE